MGEDASRRGIGFRPILIQAAGVMAAVISLASCAQTAQPADRDISGLLIAPAVELRSAGIPPELEPAFTVASRLSQENPDDFGMPTIDHVKVLLPVTSNRSNPIADASTPQARTEALLAYDRWRRDHFPAKPNPPDLLEKRLRLTDDGLRAFADDVEPIRRNRSLTDALELTDQVMDVATQDRFADAKAMSAGYEAELDTVVLTLETLTPSLAAALVDRFGTEDVAIRKEPYMASGF